MRVDVIVVRFATELKDTVLVCRGEAVIVRILPGIVCPLPHMLLESVKREGWIQVLDQHSGLCPQRRDVVMHDVHAAGARV